MLRLENEPFCDWISIHQRYPHGVPVVHGGYTDSYAADDAHEYTCVRGLPHEGSHSTSVLVRSDGHTVTVSGNVGRLDREDNLFGYSVADCVQRASELAVSYGLPSFTAGRPERSPNRDGLMQTRYTGAWFTRLDLTANFAAGSPGLAKRTIGSLSSWSRRRMVKGMSAGESVYWSNSREFLKVYVKHAEMVAHKSESRWMPWVKDQGIVRVEMELKRRALIDLDCRWLGEMGALIDSDGGWLGEMEMGKLYRIFAERVGELSRVNSALDVDLLESVPSRSRIYLDAWSRGADVRAICSDGTFRRHRTILRKHGVDIASPRNLHHLPIKIEPIVLRAAVAPPGYWLRAVA